MATLSALESVARDLLDASQAADAKKDCDWYVAQTIRSVFRACWAKSLGVSDVVRIGNALETSGLAAPYIQKGLSRLVRQGTLRSRKANGQTLYEMNL